jgi:hypothetical protein
MQANIINHINCKEGVTKSARHCFIKQIMKGDIMSRSTNARIINQQIHPKVYFTQYFHDTAEPRDVTSRDVPMELEVELLENSYIMRSQLRHRAQQLRNHYS